MTDAAEQWLKANDPSYAKTSERWKDIKDGSYEVPAQEIPWGLDEDFEILLNAGYEYVEPVSERACEFCDELFTPREAKALYCSNSCKQKAAYRRRHTAS